MTRNPTRRSAASSRAIWGILLTLLPHLPVLSRPTFDSVPTLALSTLSFWPHSYLLKRLMRQATRHNLELRILLTHSSRDNGSIVTAYMVRSLFSTETSTIIQVIEVGRNIFVIQEYYRIQIFIAFIIYVLYSPVDVLCVRCCIIQERRIPSSMSPINRRLSLLDRYLTPLRAG